MAGIGREGVVMSSSPNNASPNSFHTADQLDNDYQQDINSEVNILCQFN